MSRAKRYTPEKIVAKLCEHERLQAQGLTILQRSGCSRRPSTRRATKPANKRPDSRTPTPWNQG
jgi:hypothetical protein